MRGDTVDTFPSRLCASQPGLAPAGKTDNLNCDHSSSGHQFSCASSSCVCPQLLAELRDMRDGDGDGCHRLLGGQATKCLSFN